MESERVRRGAIWSPLFSVPMPRVYRRCIGDAARSSDPVCSVPAWDASFILPALLSRWHLVGVVMTR
eukprot:1083341-Pyramimonas_sp.AAC.1